ncbi:MAG: hypothetical protein AB7E72_17905 [Lysobacterales bacterium]
MKAGHKRKLLFAPLLFAGLALVFYRPAHEDPKPAAPPEAKSPMAPELSELPAAETTNAEAETQAPAPALQVAASVRGYRAGPAERAEYAQRLATEANLLVWSKLLVTQAQGGDADAAATLAELYRYCAEWLERPAAVPAPPKSASRRPSPFELAMQRCAGFGAPGALTAFNLRASADAWSATAAHLGHAATILAAWRGSPRYGEDLLGAPELRARAAAEELLRESDFRALAQMDMPLADLSHSNMRIAWNRTLCELSSACENRRTCPYSCDPDRQARELRQLSPRKLRELHGQQMQILQALASGDYSPLWRAPPIAETDR